MFCTVLDTSSRISNFSPVKGSEPSLRETLSGELFPPFSHVMSFDLWWHAAARLELPPGPKLLDMRAIKLDQTRIDPLVFPDWADKALSVAGVLLALDISPKSFPPIANKSLR